MFVLIRVYDLKNNTPNVAIFIDPWNMYTSGQMRVRVQSEYMAHIYKAKSHIMLNPQPLEYHNFFRRVYENMKPVFDATPTDYGTPFREESYRYKSLRHRGDIRLLKLLPGNGPMELWGKLEHINIRSSKTPYTAISYVWGSNLKQFKLRTSKGDIPLTASLYLGLRRLRESSEPVFIWADAICINQEDNTEKQKQIPMLTDIFRSATHVYAWIGEEQNESRLAIETLMQIRTLSLKPDVWPDSIPQIPRRWQQRSIPPVEDPSWDSIFTLLGRQWFRRVWIIQELVLATEVIVVCGEQRIPWDELYVAARCCFEEAENSDVVLPKSRSFDAILSLGEIREMCRPNGVFVAQHDLLTLCESFHLALATQKVDKLFALLNMAFDANEDEFSPDYNASLEIIMRRYAGVFIRRGQGIRLLSQAGITLEPQSIPSWIPDWTSSPYPKTISTWPTRNRNFSAATKVNSQMRVLKFEGKVLSAKGTMFDTIDIVGEFASNTTDIRLYLREIFETIGLLKWYPTGEDPESLKWKVPIGDARRPKTGRWEQDDGYSSFRALDDYMKLEDQDTDWKAEESKIQYARTQKRGFYLRSEMLRKSLAPYFSTALDFAEIFSPAKVCVTKKGYVGLVPGKAEKGDVVAIVNGGKVPFLIRESDAEPGHYRLVGECYIHGIMHGEGLQGRGIEEDILLH